jgi:hypothetical protein
LPPTLVGAIPLWTMTDRIFTLRWGVRELHSIPQGLRVPTHCMPLPRTTAARKMQLRDGTPEAAEGRLQVSAKGPDGRFSPYCAPASTRWIAASAAALRFFNAAV